MTRYVTNKKLGVLGQPDSKELWSKIIDQIPIRVGMKFLSVGCGHGTEAKVLANKLVASGLYTKQEALDAIYLIDKYPMFTNEVKLMGFKPENIILADFLEWEPELKFDVVLGNPPYKGKAALHQQFFNKAVDIIKDGGFVSFIQPATPYFNKKVNKKEPERIMTELLRKYKLLNVKFVSYDVFSGIASGTTQLAITILNKTPSPNQQIERLEYISGKVELNINVDFINELEIDGNTFSTLQKKYQKYIDKNGHLDSICGYLPKGTNIHRIPYITGNRNENRYYSIITSNMSSFLNSISRHDLYWSVKLSHTETVESFYSFAKTFVARFGLCFLKYNQHNENGELRSVPLVPFDRIWTDKELAKLIGLTDDELALVQTVLPDYHGLLLDKTPEMT